VLANLDPVHPHLSADGLPLEDVLLADYNGMDFPPKYNYWTVECIPFTSARRIVEVLLLSMVSRWRL